MHWSADVGVNVGTLFKRLLIKWTHLIHNEKDFWQFFLIWVSKLCGSISKTLIEAIICSPNSERVKMPFRNNSKSKIQSWKRSLTGWKYLRQLSIFPEAITTIHLPKRSVLDSSGMVNVKVQYIHKCGLLKKELPGEKKEFFLGAPNFD